MDFQQQKPRGPMHVFKKILWVKYSLLDPEVNPVHSKN